MPAGTGSLPRGVIDKAQREEVRRCQHSKGRQQLSMRRRSSQRREQVSFAPRTSIPEPKEVSWST